MTALSAREGVLEVVGGKAKTGTGASFDRARQLAATLDQPMLALKAFSAWMHAANLGASALAFGVLDFSLYCNKFAMEQLRTPDVDADLRLARARDYYQLVLEEFSDMYQVRVPISDIGDDTAHAETATVVMPAKPVPAGLLTVLLVTVHNWACLELAAEDDGLRRAKRLFALSRQIEEQLPGTSILGWSWEAVRSVTSATRAVMTCDFSVAETTARRAVGLVRTAANDSSENDTAPNRIDGDTALLQALTFYSLGVATESSACEESLLCYEEALARLSESRSATLYQSVMEQTRGQLAHFIEEEHSRERLRHSTEEAGTAAHTDRKGQGPARLKRPQGTARRAGRKVSNSRASISGQSLSTVAVPPVPEPLQQYLAEHGLSTLVCSACSFNGVFNALGDSLHWHATDASLPASLFAGTRYEASEGEPIFAMPLCTTTPLQWTLRLRETANQPPAASHRSVWSPRPTLAPLLTELAAQRPPGPKSASASQTRKEIVEGNSKLRQQVLQLFSPPSATSKVKKNAHDSVDTVVQLLGQRLTVLLKTERAFEDHWSATERVSSALRSYAVSQDVVRLKRTLLSQHRLRQMRRERSARTIVHFFRDIVGQSTRRVEQTAADRQRLAERERAAIVFQKYTRRWLALQEARKRAEAHAAYVKKVVVVQSLARRKFAKMAYSDLRTARAEQKQLYSEQTRKDYAALQIQRVYRGHCARLRCYHIRGSTHQATLHHFRDSRGYYATVIQKRVRGMLVRLQYGKAVYARRCYGRNVYHRKLWERSCVTIQRAFRAHRLRRTKTVRFARPAAIAPSGAAASCGQLSHRCAAAVSEEGRSEHAAAQRIQDAYRSSVAKRRLEALRYARVEDARSREPLDSSSATPFVLKDCVF